VIEVSGRMYPVEQRYRPLQTEEAERTDDDLNDAIVDAVDELARRRRNGRRRPGLPARRARDPRGRRGAAQARIARPRCIEILPLFARLSPAEQQRIFKPHSGGASCSRPTSPRPR
jgi:ATP-dependent helicase HrpA